MHPRYFITCPYTRLPPACNLVEFLVFSAERSSENPYHTRGKSRLLERLSPVSYLSTLTEPIPSPVYGIISRCPMYRIQVASDSAGNHSSFGLLQKFIWSVSEIQQPIEKFSKVALERNWTRDQLFTEVSPPKSCYSRWKHRCFYTLDYYYSKLGCNNANLLACSRRNKKGPYRLIFSTFALWSFIDH